MKHLTIGDTVGGTPLVRLQRIGSELPVTLLAKLEGRNPSGSVKDRVARAMVEAAEREGRLKPGMTIVEATSGNTGIGLACLAAARGYRLVLTMPESMSVERRALLAAYGAEVVVTPGSLMRDAVARVATILQERPNALSLDQFRNPANPEAHRLHTADEIWRDTEGTVDVFVAGVGTGGTVTGVGHGLKAHKNVQIVAIEPAKAPAISGGAISNHGIQGIGAGFIPPLFDRSVVDEILTVTEDEAFANARRLLREEGLSAGISSGAILAGALRVAERTANAGTTIVFMVCDGADRYSTSGLI